MESPEFVRNSRDAPNNWATPTLRRIAPNGSSKTRDAQLAEAVVTLSNSLKPSRRETKMRKLVVRLLLLGAAVAALVALASVASGAPTRDSHVAATTIQVNGGEFYFKLS